MPKLEVEKLVTIWSGLLSAWPTQHYRDFVELISQQQQNLAAHFYSEMLQDSAASEYLSHDLVKSRLHGSLQQWLAAMFSIDAAEHIAALVAQQIKVGEVHARIGIPVHLVLKGARSLKSKLAILMPQTLQPYFPTAAAMIDLAMEIMSQAYSQSHERNSRAEEAYRLFAVAQNIAYERDRQRAALLDWENRLMFDCAVGQAANELARLKQSEFGLWFRHKGAHAFAGATETAVILDTMDEIDHVLLPLFDLPSEQVETHRLQCLRDLRAQSKTILFHLDRLFEQNSELEAGRDVLTRLLNRKFLPAVMAKEINYARQHATTFALLVIDVDHFKRINDTYGHEGGDLVLQHLAALLTNISRGGDYLFRMGGEEFLMLLVDITSKDALLVAEKIRRQVEQEPFLLPREQRLQVTVSIGVALHDGHPDYQRTMRSADEALYQAKHAGRNCIVAAS